MSDLTISSTEPRESYAAGSTPTTGPFTITWEFFSLSTDIKVFVAGEEFTYNASPGAGEFSVAGTAADNGGYSGGSVTLGESVSDVEVVLVGNVPVTRDTNFQLSGPFPMKTLNLQLNKVFAILKQILLVVGRALALPEDEAGPLTLPAAAARAGMYLAFDDDGMPIAAAGTSADLGPVSSYINTLLDDADAPTARATLGAAADADVVKLGRQVLGVWSASAIKPQASSGCAAPAWDESTTNKVMTPYLAFDAAAQEYAQFVFKAPAGLDEASGIYALITWKEAGSAAAHVCVWQIEMQAQGDGDTIDSSWGAAVTVNDTGASGKRQITAEMGPITPGGSWAAGDDILVRVSRKAADGSDTLDVDAHLIEVALIAIYDAAVEP